MAILASNPPVPSDFVGNDLVKICWLHFKPRDTEVPLVGSLDLLLTNMVYCGCRSFTCS